MLNLTNLIMDFNIIKWNTFCKNQECLKRASFNYKNEKYSIFCASHKKPNMINLRTKKCLFLNCDKESTYNYIGTKTRLYCILHKKEEMVNIKKHKNNNISTILCNLKYFNSNNFNCKNHKITDILNIEKLHNNINFYKDKNSNISLEYFEKLYSYLCENCENCENCFEN